MATTYSSQCDSCGHFSADYQMRCPACGEMKTEKPICGTCNGQKLVGPPDGMSGQIVGGFPCPDCQEDE